MNKEYKPINNLWKDSEGYRYFGTLKLSSKIKYDGDDFIQLWEWVNQLQQENNQLKEESEYTIGIVEHNRIISEKNRKIRQLKKQIYSNKKELCKRLISNWNKLKEYLTNRYNNGVESISYRQSFLEIRALMQKLEQGDDSNVKD